jgi:hypothetical protein
VPRAEVRAAFEVRNDRLLLLGGASITRVMLEAWAHAERG